MLSNRGFSSYKTVSGVDRKKLYTSRNENSDLDFVPNAAISEQVARQRKRRATAQDATFRGNAYRKSRRLPAREKSEGILVQRGGSVLPYKSVDQKRAPKWCWAPERR